MYTRYSEKLLKELLLEFRILYLTGPRQSGKTTLARKISADLGMQYISLDEETALSSAQNDPQGFIEGFTGKSLVLDEFQYAPELVKAVKMASDLLAPDERGRFFLTGSADIFCSAKTQEALPGHMARVELYPLSMTEKSGTGFNVIDFLLADKLSVPEQMPLVDREQLAQSIIDGGYPELQNKKPRSRQLWFQSYLQGRLFKDFQTIYSAKGDYHSKLKALIPYLAGLCGNLLKYASIANDLGQNDKVVKSYIEVLEWMFIVKRLSPYFKNRAKRQALEMTKLHMVDTGLACHLLGLRKTRQLLDSSYYGGLLESFVVMELFKQMAWAQESMQVYHFRDKRKNKVDLVLEQDNGQIIGLEVKASNTIRDKDFTGLDKLAELAGEKFKYGLTFYTGSRFLPFAREGKSYFAVPMALFWL